MARIVDTDQSHAGSHAGPLVEDLIADDAIRCGDWCVATRRDEERPTHWRVRRAKGGDRWSLVALHGANPGDLVRCGVVGDERLHQLLAEAFL
jgi:hypothetical protein